MGKRLTDYLWGAKRKGPTGQLRAEARTLEDFARDCAGPDEGYERAANLARDIQGANSLLGETEVRQALLQLIIEIKETEADALQRARAKLEWYAERESRELLDGEVRQLVNEAFADALLTCLKRRFHEWRWQRREL